LKSSPFANVGQKYTREEGGDTSKKKGILWPERSIRLKAKLNAASLKMNRVPTDVSQFAFLHCQGEKVAMRFGEESKRERAGAHSAEKGKCDETVAVANQARYIPGGRDWDKGQKEKRKEGGSHDTLRVAKLAKKEDVRSRGKIKAFTTRGIKEIN